MCVCASGGVALVAVEQIDRMAGAPGVTRQAQRAVQAQS
jgi:hypothetical protein